MKSGIFNAIRTALLIAGITKPPSDNQINKWGEIQPSINRTNKRAKIRLAHAKKAEIKLNAKRKRKKIAKRARK